MAYNVNAVDIPMYLIKHLSWYGLKLREMMLAPFKKHNAFNKSGKDGKFSPDLVDLCLTHSRPSNWQMFQNVQNKFKWEKNIL